MFQKELPSEQNRQARKHNDKTSKPLMQQPGVSFVQQPKGVAPCLPKF